MSVRSRAPRIEILEKRTLLSAAPDHHVLIISVDGLHQADVADPALARNIGNFYVWVGNPMHFTFKNGEHGGFSNDDRHVALIVAGGNFAKAEQGLVVNNYVLTQQIAVTALDALGLDPRKLQGAVIDHTAALLL